MMKIEPGHTSGSTDTCAPTLLTSLELFAGAGGLVLGTHAAGFQPLGLLEWDNDALETLRENSQHVLGLSAELVVHCDVRTFDYQPFAGRVHLLSGGPPCQPFSYGGLAHGATDERDLFPAFFRAMAQTLPDAVLVENVQGFLRPKFQAYVEYLLKRFRFPLCLPAPEERWQEHDRRLRALRDKDVADHEQYVVMYQPINTADYGIPQRRERIILSAFRRDLGIAPFHLAATHSREALLTEQWVTGSYWEKRKIAPYAYLSPADCRLVQTLRYQRLFEDHVLAWSTIRDAIDDLPEPVTRGQSAMIPNHIQHPGARTYPGHSGSVLDYPAKAIKAGGHGVPGGENMLRLPEGGVRYMTVREAARLQTFPDAWRFHGSWGKCMRQIGNAVPADVIQRFAEEIHQRLRQAGRGSCTSA